MNESIVYCILLAFKDNFKIVVVSKNFLSLAFEHASQLEGALKPWY